MSNGRKFTVEFKVKAVELVKKTEKPIKKIARSLGIAQNRKNLSNQKETPLFSNS